MSCAPRCYVSPFPDFTYHDTYNNKITTISRGMFAPEIDTIFLRSNLSSLHLNKSIAVDTLKFDYRISEIEKIRRNVYLLYVEAQPRTSNQQVIDQYKGCKNYTLKTKKVNGKLELAEVKLMGSCMWLMDKKTKRWLCR
jgi:hypothetical protein